MFVGKKASTGIQMLLFSTCISSHQLIQSRKYVETFNERVKIKLQMCLGLKRIIC